MLWQEAKSKFSKSDSEFHAEIRKLIENFQIESTRKNWIFKFLPQGKFLMQR